MDSLNNNFDAIRPPRVTVSQFGTPEHQPHPKKRRWVFRIILMVVILILVGLGAVFTKSYILSAKVFVGENKSLFEKIGDIFKGSTGNLKLQGEKDGQINILLLGVGGAGHDGPYLSDTMIVAQIRPEDGAVSLVSIPRDYLVDLGKYGKRKINAAFAEGFGANKNWEEGGALARNTVSEMSGLNIPYFAVVDFSGFEKAINQVGGIDVVVDRTFTDYQYPDANKGYLPPVTFKAGPEHMNGARALIFARSRKGNNNEGSDFARSIRQQKIIQAFKAKAGQLNPITDLGTLNQLLNTFADHFHTNLTTGEMLHLYSLAKDLPDNAITSTSLDPETGLVCPSIAEETGAYILIPCNGYNKTDIVNFFKNSFATANITQEKATVWVATKNPSGYAYRDLERKLTRVGMRVFAIDYTQVVPVESVVYSVNDKPATLELLKNVLPARQVSLPPPGIVVDPTKTDFIVILGTDYKYLVPQTPPPPPVAPSTTTEPITSPAP